MKKQTLPSIPEDNTILELYKAFLLHLQSSLNIHSKTQDLSKHERRLDSFARLVEGDGKCSAIYLDSDKIIIASNSIHEGSRTGETANRHAKFITEMTTYFHNLAIGASEGADLASKMILVSKLCFLIMRDRKRDASVESTVIKYVEDFFRNNHSTKEWRDDLLRRVKNPLEREIIKQVSRTARDFLKLEQSIKQQGEVSEQFCVNVQNNAYQILYLGKQDIHAEIRVLEHIFRNRTGANTAAELTEIFANMALETTRRFIGISKLCCAHCSLTLKATSAMISTRGEHGQIFEWAIPDILQHTEVFKKFVGEAAYKIFDTLDEKQKTIALQYIGFKQGKLTKKVMQNLFGAEKKMPSRSEMYADSSESDVDYQEKESYPLALKRYRDHHFETSELPQLKKKLIEDGIDVKWQVNLIANNNLVMDLFLDGKITSEQISQASEAQLTELLQNDKVLYLLEEELTDLDEFLELDLEALDHILTENFIRLLEYRKTTVTELASIYSESEDKLLALDDDSICEIIIEMDASIETFSAMYDENPDKFDAFANWELLDKVMSEGFEEISKQYDRIEKRINGNLFRQAHIAPIDVLLDNLDGISQDLWEEYDSDVESENHNYDAPDSEEELELQVESAATKVQALWRGTITFVTTMSDKESSSSTTSAAFSSTGHIGPELGIMAIDMDGNCMYNSLLAAIRRLSNYEGSRHRTLEELRKEIAEEIKQNQVLYFEALEVQIFENIRDGDFVGFQGVFRTIIQELHFTRENARLRGENLVIVDDNIRELIATGGIVGDYINMIQLNAAWGGNVELGILSRIMGVQIIVHRRNRNIDPPINNTGNVDALEVHLDYNGGHYNLIIMPGMEHDQLVEHIDPPINNTDILDMSSGEVEHDLASNTGSLLLGLELIASEGFSFWYS